MHKYTMGSSLAELGSGDSHTVCAFGIAAIGTSPLDAQAQGTRAGRRPSLFWLSTGRAMPAGRVP